MIATHSMRRLLYAVVFTTGAVALVFENLWFRQAGLAFGNSVWASSLVLAGFMAGLGLGNLVATRVGDAVLRPVRFVALLEVAVAAVGLLLVYVLPDVGRVLARELPDVPLAVQVARFVATFILLLVPSTGMGMTLPLLTRALVSQGLPFGPMLGVLYGVNTLGATVGTLVTESVLVPALGIRGTGWLAAGCDLAAVAILLAVSPRFDKVTTPSATEPLGAIRGWPWLAATFASGFALLALEVVWFRFLLLYAYGRPTTFSTLLACVLVGIGLGGAFASRMLAEDPDAHRHAGALSVLAAVATIAGYRLFPTMLVVAVTNGRPENAVDVFKLAAPLIVPACFASGAFFTLAGSALRARLDRAAGTVGALTLANTLGAGLGSIVAGFVLLPRLGIETSLLVLAAILGSTGLALLPRTRSSLAFAALLVVAVAAFPFGAMRDFHIPARQEWFGGDIVGVRETLTGTLVYTEHTFHGERTDVTLITNNHSMAGSRYDSRRYMKLFTWIPAALVGEIDSALLISFGCGQTARSLVDTPSLRSIDVVDISRDIIEMNALVFPDAAQRPTADPRVHVHIEDGRYFLASTRARFDLITAEPPPPIMAGVVNLYTEEYFQLIHGALTERGVATYWLPIHDLSDRSSLAILRAFCDVFADCTLWRGQLTNLMMMGSRAGVGPPIDRTTFDALWQRPDAAEIRALGFEEPGQLPALLLGDRAYIDRLTANTPPLIDDFPAVLQLGFEGSPILSTTGKELAPSELYLSWLDSGTASLERFRESPTLRALFPPDVATDAESWFSVQDVIDDLENERPVDPQTIARILHERRVRYPVLLWGGSTPDLAVVAQRLAARGVNLPDVHYHLAVDRLADRDGAGALRELALAGGADRAERIPELDVLARGLLPPP